MLASSYENALLLAKKYNCHSIALPLISSGIYGYPYQEALDIAKDTIKQFLAVNEMDVYLVLFK